MIRRRFRVDPTLLNDFEMAIEGNGDLSAPDLRTMKELCQPTLNGQGGPIASIAIQETKFGLKNDMIQQVQNSCQFHGLPCEDTNKHLDKFLHPSLAKPSTYMLREPIKVVILTNLKYFQNQKRNHGIPEGNNQGRNQFFQGASHGQNPPPAYQAPGYQAPVHQALIPQPQVVTTTKFTNYMKANDTIFKNMQTNMNSLTNSNLELKNMFGQFIKMNSASSSGLGTLPGNTITNPKEDLKGITTRRGNAYQGPTIPTTSSSLPKVVECETEVTKDTVPPTNNRSTKDVQPSVVQIETPIPNSEPVISPVVEPVVSLVSAPKPNQKPSIPYPSRLHDQKYRNKANDQKEKIFQILKDLNFNISFTDALILMLKFGPTIKCLLTNKDKLFELARTPLNEHCSAVLLKKLPEKLGDPVLGFSDVITSCNPTPYYDTIVSTSSLTLTPFGDSDFLLEEVDAFLALEDDPTSLKVDHSYYDTEGDILLLEAFLNDDPLLTPPNQGMYLPLLKLLIIGSSKDINILSNL
nr:reverse transcriptase domain-containing protein [Tanacetum cinerariifolium]